MAKLIVALCLLSVGLANGLANYGGCTCEVDDFKERFERLESLVEFIASKATASPTLIPPELNGCGEPCADVVTLDSAALDTVVEIDGNDRHHQRAPPASPAFEGLDASLARRSSRQALRPRSR